MVDVDRGVVFSPAPRVLHPPRVRRVKGDGSCLFHSVIYGAIRDFGDPDRVPRLRRACCDLVQSLPAAGPLPAWLPEELASAEARREYCRRVMRPREWGSSVDVSVLCAVLEAEIVVLVPGGDFEHEVQHFGFGMNYSRAKFLMFNGTHYDAVVFSLEPEGREGTDIVFAPSRDGVAMGLCRALLAEFRSDPKNKFLSLEQFAFRCDDCGAVVEGKSGAEAHERDAGHHRFVEIGRTRKRTKK